MKKKYSVKCAVVSGAFCFMTAVCITVAVFQFLLMPKIKNDRYGGKLREIRSLADEYYVGEINNDSVDDYIAAGYVAALEDKYSGYVAAADAEGSINSLRGINDGIGVLVSSHPDHGTMYVIETHNGGPAARAGILPGDEIISADGVTTENDGYEKVLQYIRSLPDGAKTHITLMRDGRQGQADVVISHYESQSVFYRNIGNTAYISITEFNDLTAGQFKNAVNSAVESKAAGIVFDLRGNGGGTLDAVIEMLDFLLPKGMILNMKYKDSRNDEMYMSDESCIDIPMAVLTDKSTASASEIFAQSLKDYKKAITVGRTTYGKGVVQRTFTLSDGSLVRFTVAKYYTANGTCLDGVGVTPDVETEWSEDEQKYRLVNGIENDKDFIAAVKYLGTDQLS